jgi:hypothetical protein
MLQIETEYRVGRRARFIRTYRGLPAFVAIVAVTGLSLALAVLTLLVGLVVFALRTAWLILVAAMHLVVAVLSAPFRAARAVSRRVAAPKQLSKPAWVAIDDVA